MRSLHNLSCCSELWRGDRKSIKIGISLVFSMFDVNAERWMLFYSTIARITLYIIINTWWSMKTKTKWVFLRSIPRVKTCPRVIDPTHADGYMQLFPLHILPLFNVYRCANNCASRVIQLYSARRIIYSANESLNAISPERVLLFTFWLENCTLFFYRELNRL